MKIDYLYKDEISSLLEFNEDNGKYEKEIGNYKVELNSWNNKLFIKEKDENCIINIPTELIRLITAIDRIRQINFEDLKENSHE